MPLIQIYRLKQIQKSPVTFAITLHPCVFYSVQLATMFVYGCKTFFYKIYLNLNRYLFPFQKELVENNLVNFAY